MNQRSAPLQSIATCPICGGGLCGIRICTGDDPTEAMPNSGFVMCDECEAIWIEPDVQTAHIYLDPKKPACPICRAGLWGASRWADRDEVAALGWTLALDPSLSENA